MDYLNIEYDQQVAVVWLDQPGEKVNKLDEHLIEEFRNLLDILEQDTSIIGAVLISGKEHNFIAGADLDMLKNKQTAREIEELSWLGNQLLLRLDQFPKPVAAAIHGPALGGGLEVAMACSYRVASNHSKTHFGQPEVKLGICPGGGGTQRLPRLIGLQKSLTYLLTGKNIYPRQALKMGLVDELTHRHAILSAAKKAVRRMHEKNSGRKDKRSTTDRILDSTPIGRNIIFSKARERTEKQTRGNYPAPPKIIDCVEYGFKNGLKAGLKYESEQFGKLAMTRQSRELVNLFFAIQDSKKNPFPDKARKVNKMAVLGAGMMGSGIAEVSVDDGLRVLLKDQTAEQAAKGEETIWNNLQEKVDKHIISTFERDKISSHVTGVDNYKGFGNVDLVIEAVFEDLELKREMVKEVEQATPDRCIFASNTSSLPIGDIAENADRPEQIIGMHYFSPVQKMPLLEIIRTSQTADWVTATAFEVGVRQGKNVIIVNDGPGFYTTRILAPYMNEALKLLEEGADIEQLDRAMKNFGFPVGPVALLDEVGIDIGAHVTEVLSDLFEERGMSPSRKASELLEAGYKGRKNKQGFYHYEMDKKKEVNMVIYEYFGGPNREAMDPARMQHRMMMVMLNEAALCLQNGILRNPQEGDLGAVLGLGFPPFLGGPFRYIDYLGAEEVILKMEELETQYGSRFSPADILREYAENGNKFYPD